MTSRFRKKPVVIEAVQWDGTNTDEVLAFGDAHEVPLTQIAERIVVPTLEGETFASVGDWIICGTAGEFYPCKPDIFARIYDEVIG